MRPAVVLLTTIISASAYAQQAPDTTRYQTPSIPPRAPQTNDIKQLINLLNAQTTAIKELSNRVDMLEERIKKIESRVHQ